MKNNTVIAYIAFLLAVVTLNYFLVKAGPHENRARAYDYGIVKKGDTLFFYKDNKP